MAHSDLDATPAGDPGAGRRADRRFLWWSLAVYFLLLIGANALARWHLMREFPRLALLPPERRGTLAQACLAADQLWRGALLAWPLLTAALLGRLARARPFEDLGLARPRAARAWLLGWAHGLLAQVLLLAFLARLGGHGARASELLAGSMRYWLAQERGERLALVLASILAALGASLWPYGHLYRRAQAAWPPARRAAALALIFAAPALANAYCSPLALVNLLLLGLVLERYRAGGPGLWRCWGLLSGWTLMAALSGLSNQGAVEFPHPLTAGLPTLLSGGLYGPEGGLAATLLLLAWLTWTLRPRAAGPQTIRPEGFEPPTP